MTKIIMVLTIITLAFLQSCSLEPSIYEVNVTTNRSTYNWNNTDSIKVQVRNTGPNHVYVLCMGDIYLEEHKFGHILNTWKVHGFQECLSSNPINPNTTKEFTISAHLGEESIDSLITAPLSSESDYIFLVELYRDRNLTDLVPREESLSSQVKIIP